MPKFEVEIDVKGSDRLSIWIYTERWICAELEDKKLLKDLKAVKTYISRLDGCIRLDYEVADFRDMEKTIERDIERIREVVNGLAEKIEDLVRKLEEKYRRKDEICPLTRAKCTPRCKWYYRPWDCCLLRVDMNQF